MVGDTMNRTFVLAELRGDGYYELHCNGRLSVTTCGSTIVSPLDSVLKL